MNERIEQETRIRIFREFFEELREENVWEAELAKQCCDQESMFDGPVAEPLGAWRDNVFYFFKPRATREVSKQWHKFLDQVRKHKSHLRIAAAMIVILVSAVISIAQQNHEIFMYAMAACGMFIDYSLISAGIDAQHSKDATT